MNSSSQGRLSSTDDDLVEPACEVGDDARLQRIEHADLQQRDAAALQFGIVQPQVAQRLAQVVPGLAAGHQADARAFGLEHDAVQAVGRRIAPRQLELRVHDRALGLDQRRAGFVGAQPWPEQLAVVQQLGNHRPHPSRPDLRGGGAVGHVGDELEADPQAAGTAQGVAVQAQVQHLLHMAGRQDRHRQLVEGGVGVAREDGAACVRVVAGHRQHAAVAADAAPVCGDGRHRCCGPRPAPCRTTSRTRRRGVPPAPRAASAYRRPRWRRAPRSGPGGARSGARPAARRGATARDPRRPPASPDSRRRSRRCSARRAGRRGAGPAAGAPAPAFPSGRPNPARA